MRSVPRTASLRLRELARAFPAVLVYGPRQAGKSTLVAHSFRTFDRFDLERPRDFALIADDLEGFLDAHASGVAFDEAQRLPALFPALRSALDRNKKKGRYVLTGSASP